MYYIRQSYLYQILLETNTEKHLNHILALQPLLSNRQSEILQFHRTEEIQHDHTKTYKTNTF